MSNLFFIKQAVNPLLQYLGVAGNKILCAGLLGFVCVAVPASCFADSDAKLLPAVLESLVAEGEALRNAGNLNAAQQKFDLALQLSVENQLVESSLLAAMKMASGYNLFLLNKKELAEVQLKAAFTGTQDSSPYIHALASAYLASLSLSNGERDEAVFYNGEALKYAKSSNVLGLELRSELMRIGMSTEDDDTQANSLLFLGQRIKLLPSDYIQATLELGLARNIFDLDRQTFKPAKLLELDQLAYLALSEAAKTAENTFQNRLRAETQAGLVHLYHLQGKNIQALALIDTAVEMTNQVDAKELLAQLEAEKGDLLRLQGDKLRALNAYEHAVNNLHAIGPDMPITLPDGRSSINVLTDPIHRRYVDLLLEMAEGKDVETARPLLVKAIDSMEIIKEADMQDFFLGKCSINSAKTESWHTKLLADAAIVYPILLPNRLALILKTDAGFALHIDKAPAIEVKSQVDALDKALQDGKDFRAPSKKFYGWLVNPIKDELENAHIKTLIYVPDRDMRSIPYSAFYDGKHFVVEEFGVVTMPSLAFQRLKQKDSQDGVSHDLFAGLSKADGPSLDKLPKKMVASIESAGLNQKSSQEKDMQRSELSDSLSLPSVEKEIGELADLKTSTVLLNNQFTSASFKSDLETGDYDKVHIASHGYFGNNAKDSFIMSYDDTLSLEDFEGSLATDHLKEKPIDLLTLSACQTAQGNDRLLLGFSGMAVKSNVRSALGSLWPIDDEGTMVFMKLFYSGVNTPLEKAEALKQAQVAMIKSVKFKHPYYWSPFILTGSWQ